MPDSLTHYDDHDKTIPWHDSELIRVMTPDMRRYKLAYHVDREKGTMLELPGGDEVSVRDAERKLGWVVTLPKSIRDFELSSGLDAVRSKSRRARRAAKAR